MRPSRDRLRPSPSLRAPSAMINHKGAVTSPKWWFAVAVCGVLALGLACGADGDDDDTATAARARHAERAFRGDHDRWLEHSRAADRAHRRELPEGQPDVKRRLDLGDQRRIREVLACETDANDASRAIEDRRRRRAEGDVEYEEVQVVTTPYGRGQPREPGHLHDRRAGEPGLEQGLHSRQAGTRPQESRRRLLGDAGSVRTRDRPGTFDYFTEAINGEEGVQRPTTTTSARTTTPPSQASRAHPAGWATSATSVYVENTDKIKALEVDGGNGCKAAPSEESVQDGSYSPPRAAAVHLPVRGGAPRRETLQAFAEYYVDNVNTVAHEAGFITRPTSR